MSSRFTITVMHKSSSTSECEQTPIRTRTPSDSFEPLSDDAPLTVCASVEPCPVMSVENQLRTLTMPQTVNGWLACIDYFINSMVRDYRQLNIRGEANYMFTNCGNVCHVSVLNPLHHAYIKNMTDDVLVSVLTEMNPVVSSSIFNTLVNDCHVDGSYLMKQVFVTSAVGYMCNANICRFISNDGVPGWLLGLFADADTDLLNTPIASKFVITHSMVVTWLKQTLKGVHGILFAAPMDLLISD